MRRVTNQWATVGPDLRLVRNASFLYTNNFSLTNLTNTVTGSTTVLDFSNNPISYYYTNGLIRRIVDPFGTNVVQAWYEDNETNAPAYPRNLKSVTDKRGLVTEFKYDTQGNLTNTTMRGDIRGDGDINATATVTAAFNANNLLTNKVDAAGNTNLFFYTNTWLLSRVEFWPKNGTSGQVATNLYTYYSVSNADGTVSFGLRQKEIRAAYSPDAATNEWAYDSRGFVTQLTRFTGTTDPSLTVTQFHNARGELIEETDAIGRKIKYEHDAMGRPIAQETFEAGQTVPAAWEYSYRNGNGEVFWSDGPRFDPEDYLWLDYDGNGRLSQQVKFRSRAKSDGTGVEAEWDDALYASSFNEYNALDSLTRSIDPRGVVTTNTYDALGRRLTSKVIDTNGIVLATESFAYEAGNQVAFHTNALDGATETKYTQAGKPHFRRHPDGSTNGWRYYVDGRVHKEFLRNGSFWETLYDDANRKQTNIFKNAAGSSLATNSVERDRRGNVIRTVDVAGVLSSNVFDGLDRLKFWGGPLIINVNPPGAPEPPGGAMTSVKQTLTTHYSSAGQAVTNINAVGETNIVFSDALGRPTRTEIYGNGVGLVRQTTYAYAANHHSITITNGSGANAVATTSYTDNDGNGVLTVGYPASGVKHFTRRNYDSAGNLTSESAASSTNGSVIVWTTSTFAHDGLHRVKTQSVRDSAITTYDYDNAGNVTNRVMPGGVKWHAAYDSAGRMLEEKTLGTNGGTTRLTSFAYFATNQPFAGLLQTRTDGRGVVCTYTYDDFVRLASASHSGSASNHNLTTVWQYDVRGPVTNVTEYFALASTGPTTTVYRALTPYQQIKKEGVLIGGAILSEENQGWDSAGRRSSFGFGFRTFGQNLTWRADGLLATFSGNSGSGTYAYDTAGRLTSRAIGPRTTTITGRDGMSRILGAGTTINGDSRLTETLTWTGDGRIATHAQARQDFTDDRAYFYADQSRRLIEERFSISGTQRHTNAYTFDNSQPGKAGVLTSVGPVTGNATWSGALDTYGRIANETNSTIERLAQGRFNGAAAVETRLDGAATPLTILSSSDTNWPYQWRSPMELTPGAHQLVAKVLHTSGMFTNYATNSFTNSVGTLAATDTYDAGGFLTQRLWKKGDGTTNVTQTLSWDAKGRLFNSVERDSGNSGRDWSAVYDAFGRLLRTTETLITNNLTLGTPMVIEHFYDAEHEFLELGVSENGQTTFKVVGPDLDGVYGGQNGTGGFDAIVPGWELFCPLIGNVHAVYPPPGFQ